MTALGYADIRNPHLQWGYWLHQDGVHHPLLVDEDGRRWTSVREAFWIGRLGVRGDRQIFMEDELERIAGCSRS